MHANKLKEELNQTIVFDTLKFAKRAEAAGFTKQQAEFQAEEISHLIVSRLCTKDDLDNAILKLTIRFGIMTTAAIGILSAILKLS